MVTGKGGVGKSTVFGRPRRPRRPRGEARPRVRGERARADSRRSSALPPPDNEIREARPGLFTVNVTPPEAMREYGIMVLKFRTIYDAVFENRLVRHFLRVIPSLAELVMLGKILFEAKAEDGGRPRWDVVIVDAPATGHAVQLLRVPAALLDTVPGGPLRGDAEWMQALLLDPARTALAIVTLPEEMPVNEAIDLDAQVRGVLGIPRAALFVNAMPDSRFTHEEVARLEGLTAAPPPLGPAATAARLQALRAEQAQRYLARARAALDLPTTVLPLLPVAEWGADAIERIAEAIAATPPLEVP